MLRRHALVTQRLADAVLDDLRSLGQPHGSKFFHYLESLFFSCLGVFLGMNGLQYGKPTSFTLPVGTAVHTLR